MGRSKIDGDPRLREIGCIPSGRLSGQPALVPFENLSLPRKTGALVLEDASTALSFFASFHLQDPAHPMFDDIQDAFRQARPDVVLVEGGNWPVEANDEDAIRKYGEMGFVTRLADCRGIPVRSLDPTNREEFAFQRNRFSSEKLRVYYALRQVSALNASKGHRSLEQAMSAFLQTLSDSGLPGKPQTIVELEAAVKRLLPDVPEWRDPAVGLFNPAAPNASWTRDIARSSTDYRDEHMLAVICSERGRGKRIFAIAGGAHLERQEPTLRGWFSSAPTDFEVSRFE